MTDEIRRIDNPPEVMWAGNRSLLLTLRHAQRVFLTEPELADDLLTLARADARQTVTEGRPRGQGAEGGSVEMAELRLEPASKTPGTRYAPRNELQRRVSEGNSER